MSASVADPRLQTFVQNHTFQQKHHVPHSRNTNHNWFINSPYDNRNTNHNRNVNTHTSYHSHTQASQSNTPNNSDRNTPIIPSINTAINTKPTSQLFGTSIFGDHSHYHSHTLTSPLTQTQHSPLTQTHPLSHLITTLSYAIQEMNQYLDIQQNKPLHAKTTNCRNEMVSTLSYYQTYIDGTTSNTEPHSLSPEPLTHTPKVYNPLNQGLDFPRMGYTKDNANTAKSIALDVVGHIIGTPTPQTHNTNTTSDTPSHPSPILSPITALTSPYIHSQSTNANKKAMTKCSKLNAYAPPYQSHSPYVNTVPTQPSQSRVLNTNTHFLPQTQRVPAQNRICDDIDGKETEILSENESIHAEIAQTLVTNTVRPNPAPKTHKAPPLWSAIAKQVSKPTTAHTHTPVVTSVASEEKTPEDTSNSHTSKSHRFNYWNTKVNGSISSSTSSKSDHRNAHTNTHIITPSPSPPNKGSKRKERCRVFVSNLPSNVCDSEIRQAFAHCGEIANTVWFPSRTDGKFYGSGLITFVDGNGSAEALRMHNQSVMGRVVRCEYSSCEDPVKVKPPGCRTVYLNNVPRDALEARIREVFRHCGKIKRVRFHERDTKRTGGAFVEFENTLSCDKALELHGKIVDNHPLYVDYQRY